MDLELKNKELTRILIAETGMNISQFSNKIGVSQPYLSQILRGSKEPSPKTGYKIVEGLGLSIEDIFFINVTDISVINQ